MKAFLELIRGIDFYGKVPVFYFKGRIKKISTIGRIFTLLIIILYIVFFVYKLKRLFSRVDLSFYDYYIENDDTTIHMTKENFYFNFAFFNIYTNEPYINETIMYPIAFYNEKFFMLEPCTLDKFGSHYTKEFDEPYLDKFYCFPEFNYTFRPFIDNFHIYIAPCKHSDDCQDKDFIGREIDSTFIYIRLQDVMITPQNYSYPVERRVVNLYSYLYKDVGQSIVIDLEIANIETNTNLIGFDFLTEDKLETYIKFDSSYTYQTPGYLNSYPIYDFGIELKDKSFNEKRRYPQLFDLLSEVGGFVESLYSFFNIIGFFIINILYENSMANSLFSFNLQKKVIKIKYNGKPIKYKMISDKHSICESNCEQSGEINSNFNLKENLTDPNTDLKKINNNSISSSIHNEIDNIKGDTDSETNSNYNNYNNISDKIKKKSNNRFELNELITHPNIHSKRKINEINSSYSNNNLNDTQIGNYYDKYSDKFIINNIHLNKFLVHICFCCIRKRNNLQNILLDESMNLLSEKLDIIYIFRMMCLGEELKQKYKFDKSMIHLSKECINSLKKIKSK